MPITPRSDLETVLNALGGVATKADVQACTAEVRAMRGELQDHVVDDTRQLTALSGRVGRLETDVDNAEAVLASTGEHQIADVKKALDDERTAWRYKVTTAIALVLGVAGLLSRFWH